MGREKRSKKKKKGDSRGGEKRGGNPRGQEKGGRKKKPLENANWKRSKEGKGKTKWSGERVDLGKPCGDQLTGGTSRIRPRTQNPQKTGGMDSRRGGQELEKAARGPEGGGKKKRVTGGLQPLGS